MPQTVSFGRLRFGLGRFTFAPGFTFSRSLTASSNPRGCSDTGLSRLRLGFLLPDSGDIICTPVHSLTAGVVTLPVGVLT